MGRTSTTQKIGESQSAFRARLEDEGRWREFVYKRKCLCDQEGLDVVAAWEALYDEFAPGTKVEEFSKQVSEPKGKRRAKADAPSVPIQFGSRSDFEDKPFDANARDTVAWVFENLYVQDVIPLDAPSAGAWGLLQWVRKSEGNENDFFTKIWPKILPSRSEIDDGGNRTADDGRCLELIDRVAALSAASKLAVA